MIMFCITDLQIISTLSYSYQFKDPLSLKEIKKRLVHRNLLPKGFCAQINDCSLEEIINYLEKIGLVIKEAGYYSLVSKEQKDISKENFNELILIKKQKLHNSTIIRKDVKNLLLFCLKIPWIKAIGVTGSVAVDSAAEKDDLDFLVITSKNRLWLSRAILLIFSLIIGKKTTFWKHYLNNKIKDKWCFNLWLEEDTLALAHSKQNYFSAFESIQIDWIYDTEDLQKKYFQQNDWIRDFFHDVPWLKKSLFYQDNNSDNKNKPLISWLNKMIFLIEFRHLIKKNGIPDKNLSINQAWMHDDYSYCQYLDSWRKFNEYFQLYLRKLGDT